MLAVDLPFFITAKEDQKFTIGKTTIANYKPYATSDLTYRVTMKNREFVQALLDDKKAQLGMPRAVNNPAAGLKLSGKVSTKKT